MSYIIAHGNIIAKITEAVPSGTAVVFSKGRVAEAINADREWNLVNAHPGKIANGAGWDRKWAKLEGDDVAFAAEINPGEFFIS